MKRIYHFFILSILLLSVALFTSSCSDSEPDHGGTHRTVLVYMAANNDLSYNAITDYNEIKEGVRTATGLNGGRILVYITTPSTTPRLVEIDSKGNETELRKYSDGLSSLSIQQMRQVIDDTKSIAPADDYGLILWSHGTGWINDGGVIDESPSISPQSFGQDGTGDYNNPIRRMKISSLAEALAPHHFCFIYFDCCHMATVEVAYELRHVTDRIVASATELPTDGMPYHLNIPAFFRPTPDLEQAATNTFRQYASDRFSPGCSISLIDTEALDQLAQATRAILSSSPSLPQGYTPVRYFRTIVMSTGIFDMYHYIHHLTSDSDLLDRWDRAFNRCVTLHLTTSTVYNLPADNFHGLGSHILSTPTDALTYGYDETSWWADVASSQFN